MKNKVIKEFFECECGVNNLLTMTRSYEYEIDGTKLLCGTGNCSKCHKKIFGAFSREKINCDFIGQSNFGVFSERPSEIIYTYTPVLRDKDNILSCVEEYVKNSENNIFIVDLQENYVKIENTTFVPIPEKKFGKWYMSKYSSPLADIFILDLAKSCGTTREINYCYLCSPVLKDVRPPKYLKYWNTQEDALGYFKQDRNGIIDDYRDLYVGVGK